MAKIKATPGTKFNANRSQFRRLYTVSMDLKTKEKKR